MRVRFFNVPVYSGGDGESELNQFLASNRILAIDRQLIVDAANSAWAICVSFDDGTNAVGRTAPVPARGGAKVDYKELLSASEFAVFARLRALRKTMAEQEGVPAYALFTNEQLAEIVRRGATTITALREIHGIGESRAEKYGEAVLRIMRDAAPAETAPLTHAA